MLRIQDGPFPVHVDILVEPFARGLCRGGSGGAGGFHALGADSHGQQQHDGQSQRKQFLHFLFLPFHYCFLTFLLPTIAALIFPLAKMYISRMGANWIIVPAIATFH